MSRDTSIKTYLNEIAPTLGSRQIKVLVVFEKNNARDFTNSELARELEVSINRVTGRVFELRKAGFLEESMRRPCQVTRRTVMAWKMKDMPVLSPRVISNPVVFHQFPSQSERSAAHTVRDFGHHVTCTCKGFYFRGTCRHVKSLVNQSGDSLTQPLFQA